MEKWKHGNMETKNMKTCKHVNTEKWKHGNMETCKYGNMENGNM